MAQWDGLNRRKFPRAKYPCLVVLKSAKHKPEEKYLAHTENIGAGGLCVIVKESVKMFSEVEIELDLMDLEEHVRCKGKVVWNVQRTGEESTKPLFYDIGIEFYGLSEAEKARIEKVVGLIVEKTDQKEEPS